MIHFAKWKIAAIVAVLLAGLVAAMPNLLSEETAAKLPNWLPHNRLSLGLDLQGGSHLLLEVGIAAVVKEQLEGTVDAVRVELRGANIGYTDLGIEGNAVHVRLREPSTIEAAQPLLKKAGAGMELSIADDGLAQILFTDLAIKDLSKRAVEQSIEIIRRRIDETGVKEPSIQRQGDDRILVQLPGVKEPERIKALIGQTAKLTFRFVDPNVSAEVAKASGAPAGTEILPGSEQREGLPSAYVVQKRIMVSGENLVDAQATFQDNQPVVSFRFDAIGGKRFGDATKQNVGKVFAIVLDGKVISAPVIRDAIMGGSGIISGSFSLQEVQDLALLLRAGALPAPLTVLEERTVGADLGADSIAAGKLASTMGIVMIAVAMLVLYGLFGIFANVALLLNGILLVGALSLLQATLTLPGIAGIALTLGMAVDSNVLVFERIREEIRNGRSPVTAIDHGYREAMSTIWDANLTTLISGLIMFMLGSGSVKGFAVTLSLGIITTIFTAVMVTRLITVLWLKRWRRGSQAQTLPL